MRWRGTAIALILLAVLPAGCARHLPQEIAQRYLEDLRAGDYAGAYSLLSAIDRTARTLPEFLTEIPLAPDVSPIWFGPVLRQTQYVLAEAVRDDPAVAVVPVKITTPDLPHWERELNLAAGADGVSSKAVQHSLDTGDYPRRVYDDRIFLVKEHHHWRIVAGFAARDAVVDRHRQALNDYLNQRYAEALPQWQAMIAELRAQQATGSLGLADLYGRELARLEEVRASSAAAQRYIPKLKLSGVAMKMSEERMPAIFGTVQNTGDRPVDALALAVTWYSGRGQDLRVVSREEHPVVMTPIEFADFSRPVLPLAPGESRPFGFVLTAPTAVQQDASPYVTVGTIALAETPRPRPKPSTVAKVAQLSATPASPRASAAAAH
jgi:hypothetical protein